MSELTLYLLRHGESEANIAHIFAGRTIDPALTAVGRGQARLQGMALRDVPFQAIYASTLRRGARDGRDCWPGAGAAAHPHERPARSRSRQSGWPLLRRSCVVVRLRGCPCALAGSRYGAGFPDGETLHDLQVRLAGFLAALPHTGRPILLVGHEVAVHGGHLAVLQERGRFDAGLASEARRPGSHVAEWRAGFPARSIRHRARRQTPP